MSQNLLNPIKPAVMVWVTPPDVIRMSTGTIPSLWYVNTPENTSTEYVQVMVSFDYFCIMLKKRKELEAGADDLPF